MHMFDLKKIWDELARANLQHKPIAQMDHDEIVELCLSIVENYTPHEYRAPYLKTGSDGEQTLVISHESKELLQRWFTTNDKEYQLEMLQRLGASEKTMQAYGVLPRLYSTPHVEGGLDPAVILNLYPKFCERCCTAWNAPQNKCGRFCRGDIKCAWSHEKIKNSMDSWIKDKGKW